MQMVERTCAEHDIPYTVETGGKHEKITLHFNGRSRFVMLSVSPSDGRNAMNTRALLRRTIRQLKGEANVESNTVPPAVEERASNRRHGRRAAG
jgi:hypothetical protein